MKCDPFGAQAEAAWRTEAGLWGLEASPSSGVSDSEGDKL